VAKLMGLLAATEEAIATAREQAAVLRARVARHAGSRAALVALATLEELMDQAEQLRRTAASPHGAPARSAAAVDQCAAAATPGLRSAGQPVWREALNSAAVASSRDEAARISRVRDRMIGLLIGWDGPGESVARIQVGRGLPRGDQARRAGRAGPCVLTALLYPAVRTLGCLTGLTTLVHPVLGRRRQPSGRRDSCWRCWRCGRRGSLAQERGTLDMLGRLLSGGERNSSTPEWLTAALQAQQQTVAELRHGTPVAASVCC
jgi:hypothetical protein